jgi:DnaJ-domain-containing protein 1
MERSADQLKRKLRDLKKMERAVRFKHRPAPDRPALIWDDFFSTRKVHDASVKYPLAQLLQMEHQEQREVFEEYVYWVYFQTYKENGLTLAEVYDPRLLSLLGLPPHAGRDEVKKRFRELAKKHHPDHGGDGEKFIALMGIYEQLRGG